MTVNLRDITRKKDSVESFVSKAFSEHKTHMANRHRQWAIQLAWSRGHQNVDFDAIARKWVRPSKDEWRNRLVSNFMLPLIRRNVSKLVPFNYNWDVVPATPDEEDIEIANITSRVLQHAWTKMNMLQNLIRVAYWQSTVGNAFLKVGWDAEIGDEIKIATQDIEKENVSKLLEYYGLEDLPAEIPVKSGEPFVDPIPPFNVACDPMVPVFVQSNWILETQVRSKDWIVERFGNKWKDKLDESEAADLFLYPYAYNENEAIPKKGVLTHELYIKRTPQFKKGLYCYIANNQLIVSPKDNPFKHGGLPYVHFLEIFDPASMWGTCVAEQVRSDQAQYNRIKSGITDQINRMGKIQWLNPMQSRVTSFTNKPGEVINYTHPYKPEQTKLGTLPSYIENTLERTRRDMQDVSSDHNVSQGQHEPGLRSGKAIMALQDADDSILGSTLVWHNDGLSKVGVLTAKTIAQYSTDERTINVVGEFNQQEVLTYKNSDLVGEGAGDYFDVRVKTLSMHTMSRVARQDLMFSLVELGIFDPQNKEHRDLIIDIVGLGDTMTFFDKHSSERTRQWKEIQQMEQGQDVRPIPYENHDVHIEMIKSFLASSRRNKLDQENLRRIIQHADFHEEMKAQEMQKKMAYYQNMQMIAGANPGGQDKGQASPPKPKVRSR